MPKKKDPISQTRGFLYFLARLLGDFNAIRKGPKATVKRVQRRIVGRAVGKAMRKLFK